jgi:hypothetical protein
MGRIGDGLARTPNPLVRGQGAALQSDGDLAQIGADCDHPADAGRVDGVVVAEHRDVVIANRGLTGGRPLIAARSPAIRSAGLAWRWRTWRLFARGNHPTSCWLKSAGERKARPGRNELSKYWFARSTIPFDSGSKGFS